MASTITPVRLVGASGSFNPKTGLWTFTTQWAAATLLEVMAEVPATYLGLTLEGDIQFQQADSSSWRATATYQGVTDEGGRLPEEEAEEWEFEFTKREKAIETHWNLDAIMKYYGGFQDPDNEDRIKFPIEFRGKKETKGILARLNAKKAKTLNPVYGMDAYPMIGAVARITTLELRAPDDMKQTIGQVLDKPPIRALEHVDWGSRNWIENTPKCTPAGNRVKVTREFELSEPGGWPKEVLGTIDNR